METGCPWRALLMIIGQITENDPNYTNIADDLSVWAIYFAQKGKHAKKVVKKADLQPVSLYVS
jgi:hypothetical protein